MPSPSFAQSTAIPFPHLPFHGHHPALLTRPCHCLTYPFYSLLPLDSYLWPHLLLPDFALHPLRDIHTSSPPCRYSALGKYLPLHDFYITGSPLCQYVLCIYSTPFTFPPCRLFSFSLFRFFLFSLSHLLCCSIFALQASLHIHLICFHFLSLNITPSFHFDVFVTLSLSLSFLHPLCIRFMPSVRLLPTHISSSLFSLSLLTSSLLCISPSSFPLVPHSPIFITTFQPRFPD